MCRLSNYIWTSATGMLGAAPTKPVVPGAAPEAKVIGSDAVAALLERAAGTPYHSAILLASACGLRRGEACGLRWGNVDFAAKKLTVAEARVPARRGIATSTTKSSRSRAIHLPEFALALLRQHRVAQAEQLLRLGARLGDDDYVCAHARLAAQSYALVGVVPHPRADQLSRVAAHPREFAARQQCIDQGGASPAGARQRHHDALDLCPHSARRR
jgi:integrase